jgi:hypothetical protein
LKKSIKQNKDKKKNKKKKKKKLGLFKNKKGKTFLVSYLGEKYKTKIIFTVIFFDRTKTMK